jgi:hypothetical protein
LSLIVLHLNHPFRFTLGDRSHFLRTWPERFARYVSAENSRPYGPTRQSGIARQESALSLERQESEVRSRV